MAASRTITTKPRGRSPNASAINTDATRKKSSRVSALRRPKGGRGEALPHDDVHALRQKLRLSRKLFSRLCQYSERAIADWEGGGPLAGPSRQRMRELARLYDSLTDIMKHEFIGQWLLAPNDALGGLKPLEVIERGQIDRLWRMIYLAESGVPSDSIMAVSGARLP